MRDPSLERLAPLAEPVRRSLYLFVTSRGAPVDRDTAAAGVGVARPLAAFHLDRLVAAGLLEVEYRRRSGRVGPGAGRTAKFYLRSRGAGIEVSLPPRRYELAAEVLAAAAERSPDAQELVLEHARERGRSIARDGPPGPGGVEGLLQVLVANGYEPVVEEEGVVRLRNCPFHALVDEHRQLTCSMNLALLGSVVDELPQVAMRAVPAPREGYCCVAFVPRA